MKNLILTTCLAIGVAAVGNGHAQSLSVNATASGANAGLTLAQAMQLALDNNTTLRIARREIDAQSGALMQAGARPNPELSVSQEDFRNASRTTTFQLTQPIELAGKRRYRVEAGAAAERVAALDAQTAETSVRSDVVTRYFETLSAAALVALASETEDIARETYTATQRRVQAGKISPVDEGRAQIALNNAQIEVASARAAQSRARGRLSQVLGVSDTDLPQQLAGDLDALPQLPGWSSLVAALPTTPALQSAYEEIGRRDAMAKLERAQRVPDVSVSLGLKRVTDNGRTDNQAVVGLSIPLPVFDTRRGAAMEAAQRADMARDAYDGVRQQQQALLQASYAEFSATRDATVRLRDIILPQAERAYDATRRGFLLGKFGFLDVLDAQRTLSQARSQYMTSVANTYAAYAAASLAVGGAVDGVALLSAEHLSPTSAK
ncbi:TolC family protein [Pandoraea anhela]|uniref:Cobalt-zinc-cadmium resistance protein CzcC n=1 Tax=Pandoraea anhela TaxID=2508295 RepID=A0A5E4UAX6_9BURK|nr:TolC family protein [Pandoraea anhela]VVD97200.1 Cobalt-zinc-cadmium resistance protein CzcC [Pandoraea anhela]